MRRISILFLAFCSVSQVFSQRLSPDKYWIPLADKNNSVYTIQNPSDFLSTDAIERRVRNGIPVSYEDIPVSQIYLDSIRSKGLKILGSSKWFNAVIVLADSIDMVHEVRKFNFVLPFEPEQAFRVIGGTQILKDSGQSEYLESEVKYPDTDYGEALLQLKILGGKGLHELGYKGRGMSIAVLDAGFYDVDSLEAFRSLWDENRIHGHKDFVNHNDDFFRQSSHGTNVLSTMAAYMPGLIIGTAPEASYWLLRSEDARSEYKIEEANWVMAAEFADSAGADIIISALGYSFFNDTAMNYKYEDINGLKSMATRAADIAFEKGMIVVVSAGNEGNKTWNKITAPSDAFNTLAIGAIDTALNLAAFSSRGPSYDGRVKPDLLAVGSQTILINALGQVSRGFGTSFAAPQIAGLVACLWQAMPMKSNEEIINAIKSSADNFKTPGNDRGYGIPDFLLALYKLSEDFENDMSIRISPNPFINSFEISFDIQVDEIRILDITGKTISSFPVDLKPFQKEIITPENIAAGTYLLIGRNKNEKRISRLIKQ